MIVCRTAAELDKMRAAGRLVGQVLTALSAKVAPGVTTADLDQIAEALIVDAGAVRFRPMALTVLFALAGSLVISLTLMPVLASLLLPRRVEEREPILVRAAAAAAPRVRVTLLTLRLLLIAVVVFCLFRPVIVVKTAVPQQNVHHIIESKQIKKQIYQTRAERFRNLPIHRGLLESTTAP